MADNAAWWLKVKRAEKHRMDVKREARFYASLHPYEFIRIRHSDRYLDIRHEVKITEQPDADLALILGDFVHNLRSALDHIIYASVPPNLRGTTTSFPFTSSDLWVKDNLGEFKAKNSPSRDAFEKAIFGLDDAARAIVIEAQPYKHRVKNRPWLLGVLSQLDNSDKHRQLVAIGGGVKRPVATIRYRDFVGTKIQRFPREEYAKDKTIVGFKLPESWKDPRAPRPSEMQVDYVGATVILVQIIGDGSGKSLELALYPMMKDMLREVRRLLRLLEAFALYP